MKNKIYNKKAYIAVNCLLIGTIILIFTMSTYSIFVKDYYATLSNTDAIKANYLAETAINEGIMKVSVSLDIMVIQYLQDLKDYKISYFDNLDKTEEVLEYSPPILDNYLQIYFINRLSDLNEFVKNPFSEYSHQHNYKMDFTYNKAERRIYIEGLGLYNNTRKRIQVTIDMPESAVIGIDSFGLEKMEIYPMKIVSYYQEIFR